MSETMLDTARNAVALARRSGAQEAAAGVYRVRHVEVAWRDGRLDKITEATTRGLGIDLYIDGRYASVATSDLRPDALARFIADAVVVTRTLAPDPFRALPDPALYEGQAQVDLELEDPSHGSVDAAERRRIAESIETAARAVPGAERILSVTASYGDTRSERAQVHSNGFEGTKRATDFWMGCEVSVQDPDGRRPEESAGAGARFRADLPPIEEIGRLAATRAISRIGAAKAKSAVLPVVVENRAAGRLVGSLLAPLSAAALQQKRSFLDGRRGMAVGSRRLDIHDDPLVRRGLGSRLFDGEGIAAKSFPLFEEGVLREYYVDTYYGRKLGMQPTTGRMSNLTWKLGERSLPALLSETGDGLLVTGFLGGNSNSTTGDFSLGVQGFRIHRGEVGEPVAEMNVSGNHLELWNRLAAVGDDPFPWSPARTPSLLFEAVQLAGL